MIYKQNISREWIENVSKTNRNADKMLVEKTIRAFLLLEGLVKQNIDFVFKGGTALMLHLNSTKRLSIDIDIILPQMSNDFDTMLDALAIEQGFLRKEIQHRTSQTAISKVHYKFFYKPLHNLKQEEDFVLLDILLEEVHYEELIQLPIQSAFIPSIDEPLFVTVPSLADLLGDKLTAFAPYTTGIPYFKNEDSKSMEIIKQLYDIGNLFDKVTNLDTFKSTFYRFAETELTYRPDVGLNVQDVLEDIFQTSLCIVLRGTDGKGDFKELQLGIQSVSSFIFSETYHLEKAITHASKAAYLSAIIKYDGDTLHKFKDPMQIKDWTIEAPMNTKLNKLKKSNPEAFFYWYKIFEFISSVIVE